MDFASNTARRLAVVGLGAGFWLATALQAHAQPDACPPRPTPGNGQLCTANDLTVTSTLVSGPAACTEGETIQIEAIIGLESTARERYDIAIFVGNDGDIGPTNALLARCGGWYQQGRDRGCVRNRVLYRA